MSDPRIFVHIGMHKTGSTAIQRFLWKNRDYLAAHGFSLYPGSLIKDNHIELNLACARPDRDSTARRLAAQHGLSIDASFKKDVRTRVSRFLSSERGRRTIFTSESLSLLRYGDEVGRLRRILEDGGAAPTVIVYLRNRRSFLDSLKRQHEKMGIGRSDDPESAFYLGEDTWRLDYESLVAAYSSEFGRDHVVVIDYDDAVATCGNVLPSFLAAIGLPRSPELDLSYFKNRTSTARA